MKINKLVLGVALAGMLGGYVVAVEQQQDVHITPGTLTPDQKKLMVDADDTFLVKVPYKPLVKKNLSAILYCFMRHPIVAFQKVKTKACSEEWQEAFKSLSNKANSYEHQFAHMIQQISQEKQLIPDMQEWLQKLHNLGFEMELMTNMGKNDYEYLTKKYPDLFKLFSGVTYVTYDKNKKKIKKPMPEYFTNFMASDKNPDKKSYLLIDDKLENCQAAHNTVGFDYIKVPGDKSNAAFLTTVLQQHGVAL